MFDRRTTEGSHSGPGHESDASDSCEMPFALDPDMAARLERLADLASLSTLPIETSLAQDLSGALHEIFDQVSETTLPIYFGPLLGRLYLEGL
jgi:hypothetical protein